MTPKRIQRRRAKGWRMPEGAVYVGRPSRWGNPYVVGKAGTREECVRWHAWAMNGYYALSPSIDFGAAIDTIRWARSHIHMLVGRVLACWCRETDACHADNLAALAGLAEADRRRQAVTARDRYRHQRAVHQGTGWV